MSNFTIYTISDIDFVYTALRIGADYFHHGSNKWLRFVEYAAAIDFYKSLRWVLPHKNEVPILLDNGVVVLFNS